MCRNSHPQHQKALGNFIGKIQKKDTEKPGKRENADKKWARQGSNLRPNGYEPSALPLSYGPMLKNHQPQRSAGRSVYIAEG
jgi:hypothetical protein